jgi:DNA-binding LacI/PurR family transcriptional regulator
MADYDSFIPKHRRIFDTLREEILQGMHPNGKRLASEGQLVRHYATSRPTVARALNELERVGLVERRPGSGTYVCGAPKNAGGMFSVVLQDLGLSGVNIWGQIYSAIARSANRQRHDVLVGNLPPDHEAFKLLDVRTFCDDLIARKPLGVFMQPLELPPEYWHLNQEIVETLDAAGITVVLLNLDVVERPERSKFDIVGMNHRLAGAVVTEHLLKLGARRIAFVTSVSYLTSVEDRIAGCLDAMRKFGINPEHDFVRVGDPLDREFVMAALGFPRVDAVICVNDHTALRFLKALTTEGVGVPNDVRLASFDDVEYAALSSPALTTLRIPAQAWGEVAVDTMIQRIERPNLPSRDILLGCELVVRQSCGAKNAVMPR